MTDIPKDVMKAAEAAWQCADNREDRGAGSVEEIATAIMAERERCAGKLEDEADRVLSQLDEKEPDAGMHLYAHLLKQQAAAIRKGEA